MIMIYLGFYAIQYNTIRTWQIHASISTLILSSLAIRSYLRFWNNLFIFSYVIQSKRHSIHLIQNINLTDKIN